MSIKMKLSGFDELLEDIQKANGDVNRACSSAMKQSAQIMQSELKKQMQKANVDSGLISRMPPPTVEQEGNTFSARVGYKKGAYNPKNLSDGYKVVFINYGTPRRTKHGKVKARGFIQKTKQAATPKIKKAQKQVFEKILARLKK